MSSTRRNVTARQSSRERRAEVDVVVDERGEQVVRRGDGVDVAGEVQVDALRGHEPSIGRRRCRRLWRRRPDRATAPAARTRRARRAGAPPASGRSVQVVLPSPAGVGVIADTRTSRAFSGSGRNTASGRSSRRRAPTAAVRRVAKPRSAPTSSMGRMRISGAAGPCGADPVRSAASGWAWYAARGHGVTLRANDVKPVRMAVRLIHHPPKRLTAR